MIITKVDKFSDFAALKDSWNDLLQRSTHTVFSTWEWLFTWWGHFGKKRKLLILLAEENSKLVGIAPLMYSVHSMFGLRQGKIEFIGTDATNYFMIDDFIIEDNYSLRVRALKGGRFVSYADFIIEDKYEKCLPLFFSYLQNIKEKWSSVELTNILENQSSLSRLSQVSARIKPTYQCLYTSLPRSREALLRTMKRKDRKEIGRISRRIEEAGFKVELCDYSETNSVTDGMKTLFALNQKRWNAKGLPGAFADPNLRSFYVDIAQLFSRKGWLGLYCLKLSGKAVAVLCGFRYMDKYVAYKTGMDPAYRHFSVGNLLFLNVMEKCIQDGLVEFDFLWGADAYKKQWNTSSRMNYEAIVPKGQPFGAFRHTLHNEYWRQGERLKYFYRKLTRSE